MRAIRRGAALAWALLAALTGPARAEPVVLAAASTYRALDAVLAQSGVEAIASYAASGILARQIAQGAPADLFVSANRKWVMHLVELGLIPEARVTVLMSNRLLLIAPPGAPPLSEMPIAARLTGGEVFAMADPVAAPVGAYGQAALDNLGLWDSLTPHFVPMRNTLATLAAVSRGEAALGLVYASDAHGQPVQVLREIPAEAHPPIAYFVANLAPGGPSDAILAYLASPQGRAILTENGFVVEEAP